MTSDPGAGDLAECTSDLHDHPLPASYMHEAIEADRRLDTGWLNVACERCGLYGWEPPR